MQDIIAFLRRRKKLILYPVVIVTALCTGGVFLMEKKYESAATILVQNDELPNPLVPVQINYSGQPEDKLKIFNEIIYSESVTQQVIDSLQLGGDVHSEIERQRLVKRVRNDITTEKPGSETFRISYSDTDPVRAQQTVALLLRLFIRTKLQVENQRNELIVQFYEGKLAELRNNFEISQREVVSSTTARISANPTDQNFLSSQIDELTAKIQDIDQKIQLLERNMVILNTYPEALYTDKGKQDMYDLQRAEVPFVDDLRTLLSRYEEMAARYTTKYPEVVRIKGQISTLLQRMRDGVTGEIPKQRKLQADYQRQRAQMIDDLKRTTVTQKVDEDKESNYSVNRGLYDDLRIKLEQARASRDLGRKGEDEFVIIDPPIVPTHAAKPNKPLIVSGGLFCGLFLGFLFGMAAEFMDNRIRSPHDLEVYGKPIIAFITDGSSIE